MNKEIKEILDGLNVVIKHEGSLELDFKECKKILDCITNLQKKSEIIEENNILLIQQKSQMYEDLDKLSGRIDKALDYIPKFRKIIQSHPPALTCLHILEEILKKGEK